MTLEPPAETDDNVLGPLGRRSAAAQRALVLRTLGLDAETYEHILAAWRGDGAEGFRASDLASSLRRLRAIFLPASPHEAPLGDVPPTVCPCCGDVVEATVRRAVPGGDDLVYGQCVGCGHGVLLAGAAPPSIYDATYHRGRTAAGVGYAAYAEEASYRETKGERLLARVGAFGGAGGRLLEVGSGYGYTRAAAEKRGLETFGVDPSPAAAAEARARYGMRTFEGTLSEAVAAGSVAPRTFDLVLYQFVLEHIADPRAELALAASVLRPQGRAVVVVPNMAAAEERVFGAAYRSFRADHVHLFTRRSLERWGRDVGLSLSSCWSECNLHLLVDFVPPSFLPSLYAQGDGPDLIATFVKEPA